MLALRSHGDPRSSQSSCQKHLDKFGHLSEETLERLERYDPVIKQEVERSLLAKDELAGHAIITLAQNIYGSDARFVFELLQNADDNKFTRAQARGALPYVSFDVYPDRIILECNEDGFTEQDLQAICTVGKSSKSASHGYIGAKGIGFKSVFIAAWKVHVQSGNYSFYFKHRKGDSGLGMAVPIWQDTELDLPTSTTRMTLYLHDNEGEQLRQTIFSQLADLQETSLLFLRNLKRIDVSFFDEEHNLQSSRCLKSTATDPHRAVLETTEKKSAGNEAKSWKYYHVTRHAATGLSRSDSRNVPETAEATLAASRAEVVLAFPLTEQHEPILEYQDLFAFLPVRESHFRFVIQSDFDTSANRQDVKSTSARNKDLLDGIADAFIEAVLEFCRHQDLCYTWPQYLPLERDGLTPFWSELATKIHRRIYDHAVLMPRHGTQLRRIATVVRMTQGFMDDQGNPLLEDPSINDFVSGRYSDEVVSPYLSEYGLGFMRSGLFRRLLRRDLASTNSKMKSPSTSQQWHTIMARLLKTVVQNSQFRALNLLPLRGETWVSPDSDSFYLPTTSGLQVPQGIDLRVLDSSAVLNSDRRTLFEAFGAVEPSVAMVRDSMDRIHNNPFLLLNLEDSRDHLRFLYLSHLHQPWMTQADYSSFRWLTENNSCPIPTLTQDIYLSDDGPYGARKLLAPEDGAPGLEVKYLHSGYMVDPPEPPSAGHPSWKRWLHDFIGVRDKLRLVSRDGSSMSPIWFYIAEHKPEKLLGLLKYLWGGQGSSIKNSALLTTVVQDTSAVNLCESPLTRSCTLRQTYLPLPGLTRLRGRFMEDHELFPFLKLGTTTPSEGLLTQWGFLSQTLSVGVDDNISFLLDMLSWIKQANPDPWTVSRSERIIDLYLTMYAKFVASEDQESDRKTISDFLEAQTCLFVPATIDDPADWTDSSFHLAVWTVPSSCLWDAPSLMVRKHSMKHVMEQCAEPDQLAGVSHFFQQVLRVPNASWEDIVQELRFMRDEHVPDFDQISILYHRIASDVVGNDRKQRRLKRRFAQEKLICVFGDCEIGQVDGYWYTSNDCLWSSTTDIRGKVTLNDLYEDLEQFFVDLVGVKRLTLQMVYDELLHTDATNTVADVKSAIWSLNALLQSERGHSLDPSPLAQASVFPIISPDEGTTLVNVETAFSIGDRAYLITHFKPRIKMLDYDLLEIRQLATFLEWTGITSRYLSRSVREMTSVRDENAQAIAAVARDLRFKAHAILRVAASFNSPRYNSDGSALYRMLRSVKTMITNDISAILTLAQDDDTITVEGLGTMHISEADDEITIYVPRNKRRQDLCFASVMPATIAAWLMRDAVTQIEEDINQDMVTVLTTLLNVAPATVDLILDRSGIAQVSEANEDPVHEEQDLEEHDEAVASIEHDPVDALILPSLTPPSDEELSSTDEGVFEVVSRQAGVAPERRSAHTPISTVPHEDPTIGEDNDYRQLLEQVLRAVSRAQFPSHGAFDMSSLHGALPGGYSNTMGYNGFESRLRYRSNNQLERNFMIGAAGELYVFELLHRLTNPPLPNWTLSNWQSSIRARVALLPAYADLEPWNHAETSDLVYDDTHGSFTALLIEHGYLDASEWGDARPYYYLEVKTTTGPCGTPFYMSKGQYQRMMDIHHRADQSEVYVVLRVFAIESEEQMGMKVYVDPAKLMVEEELVFTGESWSVTPGAGR